MKRLKQKKSKKFLLITPVLALVVVGAGLLIVYALSHNSTVVTSNIPVGTGTVQIVDDSDLGFGKKEVSFVNSDTSGIPMLLRIGYSETWKDGDNNAVSNVYNGNNVVSKTWTSAFTDDFVDGGDGWYYYEKILNPSDSVKVITAIALAEPSYAAYDYDLNFRFEAIQANSEAATTLWSKTATINTETSAVTWTF
ncbi:hypothetical protein J6X13_00820 [Candidatus Saccharibacteria bacterium]|nr:hypothetical protein [Candidatus Saccharibacteria bacterium]